jgi:hypothetical protein
VQLIVEIPFQVFDVAGNERFVVAVGDRHSGVQLFEMLHQTVGRQIFSTWGSNSSLATRRVDVGKWAPGLIGLAFA